MTDSIIRSIKRNNRHNRLSIENVSIVAEDFQKNITVLDWDFVENGEEISFIPFESLSTIKTCITRSTWCNRQHMEMPKVAADGCDLLDVRWMPTYELSHIYDGGKVSENEMFAYMNYEEDYSTTWKLSLVSIDSSKHRLLIWDTENSVWAEFRFAEDPLNEAFISFLHAWMDW